MSKQPMGKTLLRNVIRHTDAHNKIQEETEMWKMRGWEMQMPHKKLLPDSDYMRGRMRCDQGKDQTRYLSHSRVQVSEHDDRDARYWTRKLYDFEANDPDRWGHSGFKELYPEEFESDDEKASPTKKMGHRKKSKLAKEACLSKRLKKSSRKKKKKKKEEGKKRKKAKCSSSDDSSNDSSTAKDKQDRKKTKNRHKTKKTEKGRVKNEDNSSEGNEDETQKERQSHRRKKRKPDSRRGSESEPDSQKKRRKDWKAPRKESSSSTD